MDKATQLRRLSFGDSGDNTKKNQLQAISRSRESRPDKPAVAPTPVEKPKFHHGETRPKNLKKVPKSDKRDRQQSIGAQEFGQSEMLDKELMGKLNPRTIAAASMELTQQQQQPSQEQQHNNQDDEREDSQRCQDLMMKAPLGHDAAIKYWSSFRVFTAQAHSEEFALINFKLAQKFYATAMLGITSKEVLKSLESSLQFYDVCLRFYHPFRYPHRWGVAALEMGMAFGAMADLAEQEIPRIKPDADKGSDAEAGFYKKVGIMTNKATDYRQRSLESIQSAQDIFTSDKYIEERAKAKVEYARGVLRKLVGDPNENRELAVFSLESAIDDYEVMLKSDDLQNESVDDYRRFVNSGPAHAYQVPVRVPRHDEGSETNSTTSPASPSAEEVDNSPLRLRGVKAAYGRALGTIGKLYLDKIVFTAAERLQAATQARRNLEKAIEVIPEDTRDRAEALLLLARAKIEQSRRGGNETSFWQASYDKALVTGIEHLREAAETCPRKQLPLRQELHWHLGRLALARLQQRLPTGKPLVKLARDAGENLWEAITLAQDALEMNAAVAAAAAREGGNAPSKAGRGSTAAVNEMNSRIGWARAELAKLCLAEASPEYGTASAIENLDLARKIHTLDSAPAEFITATCLLAEAYHQQGEMDKSIEAYREAAKASALLVNQLHYVDATLNPGAMTVPAYEDDRLALQERHQHGKRKKVRITPLTPALTGLFNGAIKCCLDRCRGEGAATPFAREGDIHPKTSFQTASTLEGGSSTASGARTNGIWKQKRKIVWTWIPDQDGTPECAVKEQAGRRDDTPPLEQAIGVAKDGKIDGGGHVKTDEHNGTEALMKWKPGELKKIMTTLELNADGCAEKRDIVKRIASHPRGLAEATVAAAARGDVFPPPSREADTSQEKKWELVGQRNGTEENRNDEIVGMTLADYMSVPVVEHSKANSQGRGPSRTGEDSGRVNAPASGSGNSSRGGTASGVRGNPKFVPLAPAHIAPPSRPAPQWIVEMQSNAVWDHGAEQSHKVVINRPRPFLDKLPTSITSCSYRSNRSPPRRGNNSMDNGAAAGRWLQRSQPYALQAFRFLCRFKQLLLLEQLALAGVWVGGAERSSKANDDGLSGGISKSQSEVNNGLRTAWMETRLEPALRSALSERRERMKRLLEDVRRLAGPFGKMMVLPRVAVETRGVATAGWDVSMVPSQRDIVRELQSFEKWITSCGLWMEQPALALLTTCSSTAPGGLAAGTGTEPAAASAKSMAAKRVTPLDHPTDKALAEMVDPYEALLSWFYSSPDGSINAGGSVANDDVDDEAELACFVAYYDKGKRRKTSSDDTASKDADERSNQVTIKPADLEKKRCTINARARDGYRGAAEGMPEDSHPPSGEGSSANSMNEEIDANDFEPGVLRVRVILSEPGTRDKLREATKGFLSAMRNRNPVKRSALAAFALQDLGIALGVSKILKALPPEIQEITVVHHGLLAIIPVHALLLEDVSLKGEPGRVGSAAGRSQYSVGAGAGAPAEGRAVPLTVLDRYSVRYTSSLYALEIAERTAAAATRDIPWYSNTCCVVEDPLRDVIPGEPSPNAHSNGADGRIGGTWQGSPGREGQLLKLRHSQHEGRVVGATWSSDPEDCYFCKGESATREVLSTEMEDKRGMLRGQLVTRGGSRGRDRSSGAMQGTNGHIKGTLRNNPSKASPVKVATAAAAETARLFVSNLNQARCLHLCCQAIHFPNPGLLLCRTSLRETKRGRTDTAARGGIKGFTKTLEADHVEAASLLKTLHLRSCAMVVLSRGGVIDGIRRVEDSEMTVAGEFEAHVGHDDKDASAANNVRQRAWETPPLGLADAFIAAGATTVVQKMWHDEEAVLADTVVLLCFYEELQKAALAGEKRPVATALRKAQLWIRGATITDVLTRVHDTRGLTAQDSEALMRELASLFKVISERGNSALFERPFTSPYYWAGFQAVGSCGDVHSLHSLQQEEDEGAESASSTEATSSAREEYRTVDARTPLGNRRTSVGRTNSTSSTSETEGSSTTSSSSSTSDESRSSESATSESYTSSSGSSESGRIDHDLAGRSTNNDGESVRSSIDRDQLALPTASGSNRHLTEKDIGGKGEPVDKTIKTVGSTYDKAGRLGGKLRTHAAATASVAAVTSEASLQKSNTPRDGSEKTVAMKRDSKMPPADGGQKPRKVASGRKTVKDGDGVSGGGGGGGGGGDQTMENRTCTVS